MNDDYIQLLKAYSQMKGMKNIPPETKQRFNQALLFFELQMTTKQIVEHIFEAFKKPQKSNI
jgi:hypothetical protein